MLGSITSIPIVQKAGYHKDYEPENCQISFTLPHKSVVLRQESNARYHQRSRNPEVA